MQSKGKRAQTKAERAWVARVAALPCVVCGAAPVEVHEFEQGQWFTAVPLCPEHHRGRHGWHGDRLAWKLARIDKDEAINRTVGAVWEAANG